MEEFRGDTLSYILEGDRPFKEGDIVRIGIKKQVTDTQYILPLKEYRVSEDMDSFEFRFTNEESMKLRAGDYVLEVKLSLVTGEIETIIQEKLKINEIVIR